MPVMHNSIQVNNILGLIAFLLLWPGLVVCSRLLISSLRNDPLICWAIGPLGLTTLYLSELSSPFILLSALFPAIISGVILYFGLFSTLPSPLQLPHRLLIEIPVIAIGVILTSAFDLLTALRDLRHPIWGEARILRTIQFLRASWASIHFTTFGITFLRDHFDSNPTDLLKAF
jgi:hypothetical protein